jgi:hypothetical protein
MKMCGLMSNQFAIYWIQILNFLRFPITASLLIGLLTGCSVQHQLLNRAGDLLSAENNSTDDDLELLMHASAYQLKLSESLLQEIPDHLKLAEAVTRGYTQYAFVYLMDEADRMESDSIQRASALRARAAKMLTRAKSLGLKSLTRQYPDLSHYLQEKGLKRPVQISKQDTGLAYWSMTAWAGAISLSKDSPDVVADLPEVLRLAELAWQAHPQFDHGALASMMGTLELAKPGGKPEAAEKYFNLAIEWRGTQVAPLISKAENWAVATQNKEAFTQLLNQAIELSKSQNDLTNAVMRRRAQWLLDSTDNLF